VLRQIIGSLPIPTDERVLIGFQNAEDAAVYKIDDERAIVASLDVITPIVDDPETYGRIAAANALSDIFAMGGEGLFSLSFLGVSSGVPDEAAVAIARGGALAANENGAPVLGGHSIESNDVIFGLLAIGMVHPDQLFANHQLEVGDQLILTQPLGTGTLTTALKRGHLGEEALAVAIAAMVQTNAAAVTPLREAGVTAVTDVTGFGLLGHGAEMAKASGVLMQIESSLVPDFPGARECMEEGFITRGNARNREYVEHLGPLVGEVEHLLLDPQTSGGLLVAVKADKLDATLSALQAAGYASTTRIGEILPGEGLKIV